MKEKILRWVDPNPALDKDLNEIDATIWHYATEKDCIDMQRLYGAQMGNPPLNDKDLLLDFIAIHWAIYVDGDICNNIFQK